MATVASPSAMLVLCQTTPAASVMGVLQKGDHVVAQRNLYANTTVLLETLLPRWGIERTFVDQTSAEGWAAALRPNTKSANSTRSSPRRAST